jgi:hypothetical protein
MLPRHHKGLHICISIWTLETGKIAGGRPRTSAAGACQCSPMQPDAAQCSMMRAAPAGGHGGVADQAADAPAAGLQPAAVANVALREHVHPGSARHQAL